MSEVVPIEGFVAQALNRLAYKHRLLHRKVTQFAEESPANLSNRHNDPMLDCHVSLASTQ